MDIIFHVYSVVFLLLQYVLPIILMSYFYWSVAKTIWSRSSDICNLMDGASHRSNKEMQMLKSKRKVRQLCMGQRKRKGVPNLSLKLQPTFLILETDHTVQ